MQPPLCGDERATADGRSEPAGASHLPKKASSAQESIFSGSLDDVPGRVTLDKWILYLDTCATYHSAFVDWMLSNVHTMNTVLRGNCNAGVTSTNVKGTYGLWEFWLNKQGIANLFVRSST